MAPGDEMGPKFPGPHGDEGLRGSISWLLLLGFRRASHPGQDSVVMLLEGLSELELCALIQGELQLR